MNWKSGPQERGDVLFEVSWQGAGAVRGVLGRPDPAELWREVAMSSGGQACLQQPGAGLCGLQRCLGRRVAHTSQPGTFPVSLGHFPPVISLPPRHREAPGGGRDLTHASSCPGHLFDWQLGLGASGAWAREGSILPAPDGGGEHGLPLGTCSQHSAP